MFSRLSHGRTCVPMTASHDPETACFPRGDEVPSQSPKYWVKEKDRYLRQLLIRDIESTTGRDLVVYFTVPEHGQISFPDADDISEVLSDAATGKLDLLINTPGGNVDACEKLISVLRHRTSDYRVVIPSWAKSAGTIISLSASEIVMGVNSELGPIDPQFAGIPGQFIADDPNRPYFEQMIAKTAIERTKKLAQQVLQRGMLCEAEPETVEELVRKLGSADSYGSHGAVIDHSEAKNLGLNVKYLPPDDDLWKRIWLLYCMYDHDCRVRRHSKVFEGRRFSITRAVPPPAPNK